MQWICCQIGAREHYAIPRARHLKGELGLLITDAWADSLLPWKLRAHARSAERYHPDIPSDIVKSFDWRLLSFELKARHGLSGWARTMARNEWFQNRAVVALRKFRDRNRARRYTLFSYSYAAGRLFEFAKEAGWSTVLGQIDPGPFEEKIVTDLHRRAGRNDGLSNPPQRYWDNWRRECQLADRVMVNSDWSRHGLIAEGVAAEKIEVVPLAWDPPAEAANFVRRYTAAFDFARPLRILFLGQVNLRKGLSEILGSVSILAKLPVEFQMVGDVQIAIPKEFENHPRVKWCGSVPRGAAGRYYRDADVFLLPTHSDGFGLTQLEAQGWRLPVIASRQCGDVVKQGINGYLLPDVTADSIARVVQDILAAPASLGEMAARSRFNEFTLDKLHVRLAEMETNPCCYF
jgi:glycosyltransferase involved in cell wall biosynthesis